MDCPIDDFSSQLQSDEFIPPEEEWIHEKEDLATPVCHWKVYDVDCDDGTHGDRIYEWVCPSSKNLS